MAPRCKRAADTAGPIAGVRTATVQDVGPTAENMAMNRSAHASASSRAVTSTPRSSQFTWAAGSSVSYGYWATGAHTVRAPRRTPIQLASDILAPLGAAPRYYALAWQFLLWLTCTVLFLMLFG
jgi:hypothetical protein